MNSPASCAGSDGEELQTRFTRAFFIFGLRRSGNHAVCEWLKGHFNDEECLHLNSAESGRFFDRDGSVGIDRATYQTIVPTARQTTLFVGYENLNPQEFPFAHNSRIAHRSDLIILLRDYPNMVASIVKSARERPDFVFMHRMRDLPEQWSSYAHEFIARTGAHTYVNYNNWFSQKKYRQEISAKLDLQFTDRGLNVVSQFGRGSSFDGLTFDGAAQSMKVLDRWRAMFDEDLFRFLLLAHRDNLHLNATIFNNFPFSYEEILSLWQRG